MKIKKVSRQHQSRAVRVGGKSRGNENSWVLDETAM
jgi:hypothetical protein